MRIAFDKFIIQFNTVKKASVNLKVSQEKVLKLKHKEKRN